MKQSAAVAALSLLSAIQCWGQASAEKPAETKAPLAFEVASVKTSDPATRGGGIRPLPGGQTYVATGVPLKLMIRLMYRITDSQIQGGPDWMNTDRFDVRAKAEKPSNIDELHEMFQTLLADRFQLKFHREMKTISAYALVVDKPGKLKVSEATEPFEIPIKPAGFGKADGTRVPMSYLCWFLAQMLNLPVVDKTGLDKFYDFTLSWTPELPPGVVLPPGVELPPTDGPTIFTALREQLGLKLESHKVQ